MRIRALKTSRGWTIDNESEPIETTLIPIIRFLASRPQTTKCSRSNPSKQGRRTAAATVECWIGVDDEEPGSSQTSVTRYRGARYGFAGRLAFIGREGLTVICCAS